MIEFKVGDKVVLRPETKPYTYRALNRIYNTKELDNSYIYRVTYVYEDGDVDIEAIGIDSSGSISHHHLKHSKQDYNDNPYRFDYAVGDFDNPRSRLNDQIQDLQEFKITPYDNEELRFMIYHGNPSRTLEEMQAIENWLLGEK